MIPTNQYSDETIHVANWLLLSGRIDLGKLISEARQNAEQQLQAKWEEEKYSPELRDPAEITEAFDECLASLLEEAILDAAVGPLGITGCDLDSAEFGGSERLYKGADVWVLIAPMIIRAFGDVSFPGVAQLVLSKMPPAAAAA